MSLGARATKGGAKAGKEGKHAQDKAKGPDKPQPKEKVKPQATTEQLRMAHMIDRKSEDASDVRRMVLELMEMTCRTEEEVCSALHDSDNDMVAACNLLLEESQRIQGEWQTSEKKKKKPPAAGNGEVEARARAPTTRPRRGEGEGIRGAGRGRGGRGVARGGARGVRGGRRGARGSRPPRPDHWPDTGDAGVNMGDSFPATEDWDNEEWSGSLSDTKVFTPSSSTQNASGEVEPQTNATEDWDTPEANGPAENIPTYTYHNAHHPIVDAMGAGSRQSPGVSAVSPAHVAPAHAPAHAAHAAPPPAARKEMLHHPMPMGMSGSLSAAQSQYLSQLTQQSQRHDNSVYTSNYGVYGATDISSQRKPQRARVPPPSKIPSMAVEMPGGGEVFLDVQFGALEPDALHDAQSSVSSEPLAGSVSPPPAPLSLVQPKPEPVHSLNESLPSAEPPPPAPEPAVHAPAPASAALEKQLSASMKQMAVSEPTPAAPAHHYHPRPKTASAASTGAPSGQAAQAQAQAQAQAGAQAAQGVYHHPVSHHPPVYQAQVYPPQQVNSTAASLTAASAMPAAYPSSVTLTQYQPAVNSYQQQQQTSSPAAAYGGSALYTAAPYYHAQQHHTPPAKHKDAAYESSVAASSNLASTPTTQAAAPKVTATTNAHASSGSASAAASSAAGNVSSAGPANTAGYAHPALYGQGVSGVGGGYAYDEAQLMRGGTTLPHHMGGYYEVGYGGREGTFGLGAGERFGRTDAASPQQVPAALPPGYAYFYQPPPTTYQYGVYPTYGGGSSVGGVGSVANAAAKVNSYTPQQPPYEQDYKTAGGGYSGSAAKATAAAADLSSTIYNKHVLNKVNSYEKAGFHSGTPPPFGASHLYIPAPHHHHHHHNQHQMDVRVNSSHSRRESGAGGGRSSAAKPPASKPTYSQSYWTPN